jgi:hypothetical protein
VPEGTLTVGRRPCDVILAPLSTVMGRIVDEQNKPLAGALVQLSYLETEGTGAVANVCVGTDGKFGFTSMIPGCEYELDVWINGFTRLHKELGAAEKGRIKDLHDIVLRKLDRGRK